ncbi:SufD family Fe-S cluster assembly protein [Weissella diestrammenae]|uniref:SufD family Fe-S cluster assembly protein n=1 Tax=Weissella diestrammenae TaxID=1162633 RepID=A0A7G9T4X1_9LACO|nr:SufD family Fe-S cluster assembly protein [Weissella diestrammenae]MCM0582863.1 SufD family Fe-S cluster assembly protein [Weissella diestrammenae]QNN75146.1 SufD family Fe-S cluster assembly protein [Weissella diestrammenae]
MAEQAFFSDESIQQQQVAVLSAANSELVVSSDSNRPMRINIKQTDEQSIKVTIGQRVKRDLIMYYQGDGTQQLTIDVTIAADSQVNMLLLVLGTAHVGINMTTHLAGEGAQTNASVIGVVKQNQYLKITNQVINDARHTIGHIQQRGIAMDTAKITFNGIGHVKKGAAGSDAQQASRLLMLDTLATGEVNPILLIDEDDVMAGHAASVGQVNQDQVNYLLSRGIPLDDAQRLVTRGFITQTINHLPQGWQNEIYTEIERQLNHE